MSTFRVEVVPVELQSHPNADSLSLVAIYGYQAIVRTEDWAGKTIGAYIPPDSVVPDSPEFAFLGDHRRIKARRLRGLWSMGLLMPAPQDAKVGDDVAERMGVIHYEPPPPKGDAVPAPDGMFPVYDVESWYRYPHILKDGETVIVTEKIHGASGRWVHAPDKEGVLKLHAGSHRQWKNEESPWWAVLVIYPRLAHWLEAHRGWTVYGEVYGQVQDLRYGTKPGDSVRLAVFDILSPEGAWLDYDAARLAAPELPWVPEIWRGAYSGDAIRGLVDGPSLIPGAGHIREGIVIKPSVERLEPEVSGRVQVKAVSNAYLEHAK